MAPVWLSVLFLRLDSLRSLFLVLSKLYQLVHHRIVLCKALLFYLTLRYRAYFQGNMTHNARE